MASESIPKENGVEVEETPKTEVFKIATELLKTEREYVRILGLIEMVSYSTFNKAFGYWILISYQFESYQLISYFHIKFRSRVERGVTGRNGDSDWADEGCAISQDDFRTMFSNVEAIHKFHHDFFLPQVKNSFIWPQQ